MISIHRTNFRKFISPRLTLIFLAISIGFSLLIIPTHARTVRPLSFLKIVERSGTIAHCIVSRIESGIDEKTELICTWTTLKVIEPLKGETKQNEITFKQLGGVDKKSGTALLMSIPPLKKGQELLLCLYPESRWGFCSPVGYTQGIFYVREDPKSREKYIDNGMPKSILFPKDSSLTPSSGRSKPAAVQPGVQRAIDRCRSLKLDRVKKGILSLTKKESRLTSPRSITPKKQWRKNKTIGR